MPVIHPEKAYNNLETLLAKVVGKNLTVYWTAMETSMQNVNTHTHT
jgi:hypothetical protein